MHTYPLFLSLAQRRILVVGAGKVGRRKIAALLPCCPEEILVLDIRPPSSPEMVELLASPCLTFRQMYAGESVEAAHIAGRFLVFAATNSRSVNAHVASLCREAGVLCNIADSPAESSFHVPALLHSGPLAVAVSTGGKSPALARRIGKEMSAWLDGRYGALMTVMGRLRPYVAAFGNNQEENGKLFGALAGSSLGDLLAAKDMAGARELLRGLLPTPLHHCIEEVLDEPF